MSGFKLENSLHFKQKSQNVIKNGDGDKGNGLGRCCGPGAPFDMWLQKHEMFYVAIQTEEFIIFDTEAREYKHGVAWSGGGAEGGGRTRRAAGLSIPGPCSGSIGWPRGGPKWPGDQSWLPSLPGQTPPPPPRQSSSLSFLCFLSSSSLLSPLPPYFISPSWFIPTISSLPLLPSSLSPPCPSSSRPRRDPQACHGTLTSAAARPLEYSNELCHFLFYVFMIFVCNFSCCRE